MKMRFFGRFAAIVCVVAALGAAPASYAFTIMAGTDYFQTEAPTYVDLGGTTGVVDLCGDPFGSPLGNTDTMVRRLSDVSFPSSPQTVPIEIVALSLVSCAPITISSIDWNLRVNLAPGTQQLGSMSMTKTHANGGTFDSVLPVQARFTFTRVGVPLDSHFEDHFFTLRQTGTKWDTRHSPGTMLVSGLYGNTVANNHTNPPSDSFFDVFYEVPFTNSGDGANHTVVSATPEPVTSALALGALAAAALRRWRRQG